jgi:hypothetical protein
MRRFLLGVLLLPAAALAQPVTVEKPVLCEKTEVVINGLLDSDYKEQPIWIGVDEKSRYSIFANEKTGSWTLIQFNEKIACILGVGEGSKTLPTGPRT